MEGLCTLMFIGSAFWQSREDRRHVLRACDKTEGRIRQFLDKNFTISRIAANVRFGDYLRTAGVLEVK